MYKLALKRRVNRAKRQLAKRHLLLYKSRTKIPHFDDMSGYMICDLRTGAVVQGSRFELTIDDVEDYIREVFR